MGLSTIAKSFTKTWKVDFLEENNIWEVPFWRVMTNVCILARFAVLLFCWSLRSRVLLPLVMPMTCVSFYLTDAQLRCEHSGKRHTHMSEQIFLQCLMQTNTVLVFAWVKSVLCTMIALSARLRLLSVWRSQWTILSGSTTTNPVSKSTI